MEMSDSEPQVQQDPKPQMAECHLSGELSQTIMSKHYESSGISDYFVDNLLVIDNMFGDVDADINDDVILVVILRITEF